MICHNLLFLTQNLTLLKGLKLLRPFHSRMAELTRIDWWGDMLLKAVVMKFRHIFTTFSMLLIWTFSLNPAAAGFNDLLKSFRNTLTKSDSLSESEIIAGLKQALEIGSANAVDLVSQKGGYYDNPSIKIPLPQSVQKLENIIRGAGFGSKIDAFELSMNQAAEKAAPEAKSIFWDAIKKMEITDAKKILYGSDNEATRYFKDKTSDQLLQIFKPIVAESMAKVGVTRAYQELNDQVKSIPFAGSMSFDLDQYVTDEALIGLFKMLAEEEKKIRTEPAARVTEILQKVFAKK